ncbi:hypothetical protein niasHS_001601 [Heterodera schachtii]|uniref:Uncharacterized protein n=1 Tax=Heterodera schachtii TaxID=97005 RepID=A0ABD2KE72_HETSC
MASSATSSYGNFELSTNLAELPYGLFAQLSSQFENECLWRLVFTDDDQNSPFYLGFDEADRCARMANCGAHLLRLLGNRGQTVKGFLSRLHSLAKVHGTKMDVPQLILRRRFCSVIWSRPEQVLVSVEGEASDRLRLQCKASAFPTPRYQWLEEGKAMDGANQSSLTIVRCHCTARNVFRCRAWNVVEEGHEWSDFYRAPGKTYHSELVSELVDLQQFLLPNGPNKNCDNCNKKEMEGLCRLMLQQQNEAADQKGGGATENGQSNDEQMMMMMTTTQTEALVAADKVALIVSNRTYAPQMSNLITPHCDAETLAEVLQQLGFKTVTLGDLNLEEMRAMVCEYRKLLGEGVYAVFYFVGHGFEANGQCYLLPIGAPGEDYGPEHCLSMDWVMGQFRDFQPALNLILLDICRKFLPSNLDAFTAYAEEFRRGEVRVNRNTVYGYATSGGVGAYEVKGEQNGVFMKYLKRRIQQPIPLLDMLNKVRDVQIPELRSNLTKSRSLHDPLVYDGHTTSYDHHTYHWRTMHELPMPVTVDFAELGLQVTIWFDFCGHFTNKVYVFSSVDDMPTQSEEIGCDQQQGNGTTARRLSCDGAKTHSQWALAHLAHLKFPEEFESSRPKICEDEVEGVSLCVLLSHLQRATDEIVCTVELRETESADDGEAKLVAKREEQILGHVLITRLGLARNGQNR